LIEATHRSDGNAIDRRHWAYAGTRLLTGEVRMHVVNTGGRTLYGEIVRSATRGVQERTPLQKAVARLVAVLVTIAILMCLVLAAVRWSQGHGLLDALTSAVTLAVAAMPEEFPVVLAFFLGVGVFRLARQQALVRRAVVVENIGRVTCICSDKTGTITEGHLHLAHLLPRESGAADSLLALAAMASRRETGDPLDTAILNAACSPRVFDKLTSFPFTEDRKRETSVVRMRDGLLAVMKGAPETVLRMCALGDPERKEWEATVGEYADSGHKVIACASRRIDADGWSGVEPQQDYQLAGLLAFEDPVREGVRDALRVCRDASIHVVMVTGDHSATALAVAKAVGIAQEQTAVVEGDAMMTRLAQGDNSFLDSVCVVARAKPAQKLSLVHALQARGEVVAVTGDGVNDVPALQAADIGIAMGGRGTRSSREIAAIVLLDDNFRSIVHAIAEGRQLFRNLQLSFEYLLIMHIPLILAAALIPLAGYPLLFLPVHIVWLELIIHPTALLVFQNLPPTSRLSIYYCASDLELSA
jgi:Ca2+-transporting ATPase